MPRTDDCGCAGLFLAPQMVGEALKGGRLVAAVADRCGLAASPPHGLGSALPHPPSFITVILAEWGF